LAVLERDLADIGPAGTERRDADNGVRGGTAGHFGGRPHVLVDRRSLCFIDQGHRALGHAVGREETVIRTNQDVEERIADAVRHAAAHLSVHGTHFLALYLLVHGIIKVALVQALLRRKLAAYPLAGIAFAAFIVYQLYRFTITRAFGLIALSVFDAVVIWLIYLEYRALRRRKMLLS